MTEPLLPLSDEDLSAYLDDEVTPEARARIDGDPKAQERVRALGAAQDALRTAPVTPLSADVVESMISRALQDVGPRADAPGAPVAPPMSLDQRRRGGSARSSTWMVAAAVVALVAIGLGLVWSGVQSTESSDSADRAATESDQQTARSAEAEAGSDGFGAHDSAFEAPHPVSTEPAQLIDLGTASDHAALRTSLRDGLPTDADPITTDATEGASDDSDDDVITVGQVDRCAQVLQLQVAPDSTLLGVGLASVDGDRYLVYEFELPETDEDGDYLITAVDPGSCAASITFIR